MHREGIRGSLLDGTRTILFDLEGTLVDFRWDLAGAVRDVLSILQASGISPDKVRSRSYSTLMPEAMQLAPLYRLSPESVRQSIGEIYDKYDVGDSLDDINASRNAGIRIIVIADGESRVEDIRAASPDGVIRSYSEL